MICDICGAEGAFIRKTTEAYGKGKSLMIVENVPLVVCSHCGESYYTAETLHELERIRIHRKSLSAQRSVRVANFA
ncbi:MAG TPA: type II toxin-antitoxin system MqsA family antitoxin [bacterium]|jgi:YgiT-type zinc finger domain-containing protein